MLKITMTVFVVLFFSALPVPVALFLKEGITTTTIPWFACMATIGIFVALFLFWQQNEKEVENDSG